MLERKYKFSFSKLPCRMSLNGIYFILSLLLSYNVGQTLTENDQDSLPNIVLFLADDLGIGDVGIFGNNTIRTPNIDAIGHQGALLNHHLAASSVCTPSRAAFLTGRYAVRSGMVPTHVVRVNMFVSSTGGLPSSEITFAEILKEKGYVNGFIGKWHLGMSCLTYNDFCHHPLNQGFDYFYGLPLTNLKDFGDDGYNVVQTRLPYIDAVLIALALGGSFSVFFLKEIGIIGKKTFWVFILLTLGIPMTVFMVYKNIKVLNGILMRNYEVVEQPINLGDNLAERLVKEGRGFMEERRVDKKPFLLVMSWVQVHTALHTAKRFKNRSNHGKYGDNVEELDWSVGEILNSLKNLGFKENTFVYFTSDNGGHVDEYGIKGNREGGHNGVYRGGKTQGGMEGGIRVPTVMMWPGYIPTGLKIHQPTSLMDILPTLADITGATLPQDRIIDGTSLVPLLVNNGKLNPHEFLFHYCGTEIHAARYAPLDSDDVWKVHFATPRWNPGTEGCGYVCDCYGNAVNRHNPPLMYNIAQDPSENKLIDLRQKKFQNILEKIMVAMEEHMNTVEPVSNQYAVHRMLPLPWLQPCCNFPYCKCRDTKHLPSDLIK